MKNPLRNAKSCTTKDFVKSYPVSRMLKFKDTWRKLYERNCFPRKQYRATLEWRKLIRDPNVSYDLDGFFKIDGVLYYITDEITDDITNEVTYNLSDLPFQCVVVSSVYYYLKNDDSEFHFVWKDAFNFLLDARFHKELRDLLKNGDFVQKNRKKNAL